jgi:hypothetical protein
MNNSSSRSTVDVILPPWCTVELRDALDHETLFPKTYLDSDEKQKLYFEVQPNASFEVLITVNFEHGSIFAPYDRLLLKLALDGEDVGFTKRCTSPFIHQHRKHGGKGRNHQ